MEEEKRKVPVVGMAVGSVFIGLALAWAAMYFGARKAQIVEFVTGKTQFHVSMCDTCEVKLQEVRDLNDASVFAAGGAKPYCLVNWQTLDQVKAEMRAEGFRPGTFQDLIGYYDTNPEHVPGRSVYSIATEWVANPTVKPENWRYTRPKVMDLSSDVSGPYRSLGDDSSRDYLDQPAELNTFSTNCVIGVRDTLR